jgi:hypothetical protein
MGNRRPLPRPAQRRRAARVAAVAVSFGPRLDGGGPVTSGTGHNCGNSARQHSSGGSRGRWLITEDKTMRGRKPFGPELVHHVEGTAEAKKRAQVILETLTGRLSVQERKTSLRT